MAQGTVGLRFNIDVSQAKGQVEGLSKTITGLNDQIAKATEAGDWRSVAQLTQALDNTTSSRSSIMQQARQAQGPLAGQNMNNMSAMNNTAFGGQGAWILQTALNQITRGIISSMDAALSAAKQRASGEYAGAAVTEQRARGEIGGQGIGAGVGAGLGVALTAATGQAWLIPLLAGLGGEVGKFLGGIDAKKTEEDLAYSNQYKSVFRLLDTLNQNFGGAINTRGGEGNNQNALGMYRRASNAAAGTGLSTQDFIQAISQMSGYGVRDETQALNMARNQALWSRYTGADLSSIQKFAGSAYRFGGETGAVGAAYGGLMAQGMARGQMSEFLTSMGRIMEEGIAKGFVRSSEEIAGNMTMLYKLSGGSALWQGEQGAQRLSQMNAAIANATNLSSIGDVISFGVARDLFDNADEATKKALLQGGDGKRGGRLTNSYVDYMMLLEQGVSAPMLEGQFNAVKRLEGNNVAGMIERFRTMYGLNYTGASQVWGMMDNIGKEGFKAEDIARQIKALQVDPKYQSDSEKLQAAINAMNANLVDIGKLKFDLTEYPLLTKQAEDVASILDKIRGGDSLPVVPPALPRQVFDPTRNGEADRPGMARDYFATTARSSDPAFNEFQAAYKRLTDPYSDVDHVLFGSIMGNDYIQNIQGFLAEAQRRPIDDNDRYNMNNDLANAVRDLTIIIRRWNQSNNTNIQIPETIQLTEW